MNIYCINHDFLYETEKLLLLFLPNEKNNALKEFVSDDGDYFYTEIQENSEEVKYLIELSYKGEKRKAEKVNKINCNEDREYELLSLSFPVLSEIFSFKPKWGMLTGVRPSKLLMKKMVETDEETAVDFFKKRFFVSDEKTELALSVSKTEWAIIEKSPENSFSLYISIPFCPTRCSYCSFVSHSIGTDNAKKLVPEYVEKLCEEIAFIGKQAKDCGLILTTVYWGGGTPTTLSAEQLDTVLTTVEESFDLSNLLEYTVEAGRPDTVTEEKLDVLKKHNVSRISINPQTFNNNVLKIIGRNHTAEETEEKFLLAKSKNFNSINTDLIAGLPGDSLESFKKSVDKAISLDADNITVHTLTLKRSSNIVTENEKESVNSKDIEKMLDYSFLALTNAGYKPYYMYRQTKSLNNLENVGWCKEGKECVYNILMMEEYQHILSVGAGSVTKLLSSGIERIERIFNYKFPFEYISRFSSLIEKKGRITEFFKEN